MRDFYEEYWSPSYWRRGASRSSPQEVRDLLHILDRWLPKGKLLDAGCGDGAKYGRQLAERAIEYIGVDVATSAVSAAVQAGLNARTIEDLSRLPFANSEFDACVCVEVLEHVLFPDQAILEVGRVLRPGGTFICTVPNVAYWRRRIDLLLLGRWHPGGHPDGAVFPWRDPHLRFFTKKTLRRMLVGAGFTVVLVTGINGSLFGDLPFVARRFGSQALSRPFRFLQFAAPSLFAANLVAIARR